MNVLQSIILGITEGVTEFLPISSTGHLILVSAVLGVPQNDFAKSFEIIIQFGAILAVVVLYWRSFLDTGTLKKLVVAFVPTGIIGFVLYHFLKVYLLGNMLVVVASLFVGGVIFIAFEKWYGEKEDTASTIITYRQALLIGAFQAIAIIPGVSRSGATILGGMTLGVARTSIVEFSFLLAVPTMLAAAGLDLVKTSISFTSHEWFVLSIGFVTSFIIALPSIRWLLGYVRKHSFISFGIYRILLSFVCIFFFFF